MNTNSRWDSRHSNPIKEKNKWKSIKNKRLVINRTSYKQIREKRSRTQNTLPTWHLIDHVNILATRSCSRTPGICFKGRGCRMSSVPISKCLFSTEKIKSKFRKCLSSSRSRTCTRSRRRGPNWTSRWKSRVLLIRLKWLIRSLILTTRSIQIQSKTTIPMSV